MTTQLEGKMLTGIKKGIIFRDKPPEAGTTWAIIGVVFLVYFFYVMGSWITSSDFARTMPASPVPDEIKFKMNLLQVVTCFITVLTIYYFVIKPKLRTGRFSFLALFMFAHITTLVHDPLGNYSAVHVAYNAYPMNMGSWANFIPGFLTPNQNLMPESFFMMMPPYIWYNCMLSAGFAWVWRKLAERFPQGGTLIVIAAVFIVMMVADLVAEFGFIRSHGYSYIGGIQSVSLWSGTMFQFPLYIPVLTAMLTMGFTTLLYYRDDKGESWADRGIGKLKLSDSGKTFVRFLSLTGAMHMINLVTFWMPLQFFTMNGDTAPATTPNYIINNICGEGTPHPCNGANFNPRRSN
ncbi:spirocyclase AveC family protein [Massilia cavernae]|nr:spirocyclase AveC family protein [Massilia cavernae]